MIIKRFQAKSETEATALAQKELGSGVVIMNVKTIRPKGLFAIFRSKVVEVTAAVEEESDNPPVKKAPAPAPSTVGENAAKKSKPTFPDVIPDEEEKSAAAGKPAADIEARIESIHTLLEESLKKEENAQKDSADAKEGDNGSNSETIRFLKLIYSTLIENEVDEKYANEIVGELEKINIRSAGKDREVSMNNLLSGIYQKMILMFGQASTVQPAQKGPRVVYFIGPTGVGKTTTIAKIASKLCVEEKKKVALVTTDTYRIAATDQLKTYANIMATPFRIVYTVNELEGACGEFSDYDYIMVDTAGHSPRNDDLKESTRQFLHALDDTAQKEVYLVLSATTKYKDLIAISDMYRELDEYKLIFTKLDETGELGNLWNIRMHTGAAMSYVTTGQNVPGDIEAFNPQATVKKLLGGQ